MESTTAVDKITNLSSDVGEEIVTLPMVYISIFVFIILWVIYKKVSPYFMSSHKTIKTKSHKVNFNCPVCSTNLRPSYERMSAQRIVKNDIVNITCPVCMTKSKWDVLQENTPVLEGYIKKT